MDIKQLLEKMEEFAGEKVGQKPGEQWRGTDKGTPGKKLVGDSIIKDLSKGPTPKTREQELAEEWATFSEENIGTHPKRPRRKSDRHARGHEPQPRYKTIKADESAMGDKDIELQDYRSMSHKEFQTAYGMNKTEWINKNKSLVITNPKLKQALGLDEGKMKDIYTDMMHHATKKGYSSHKQFTPADYDELAKPHGISGKELAVALGHKKVSQVDEAGSPAQQAAIAIAMKKAGKKPKNEGAAYKATNQHPASRDPIVAQVVKQMRPGLTGLAMGNEAFLYFAYELGKQRARDAWSDYLPAIRDEYEKGLEEASYYGPVEARWMVKLSDDEGDHLKTYHDKFPSLSAAKKAYKNTPYATDFKYKPVKKDQVEEAIDSDIVQPMGQDSINRAGYNPLRDKNDYDKKVNDLIELGKQQGQNKQMQDQIQQRILDLRTAAIAKGFIQAESRGHTIIANKLKDVERAKKFASGELKIPTPQERQAQLKQLEKAKPVKEFVAPPQGTANQTMQQKTQAQDPKQAQAVAQATQAMKSATGSSAPTATLAKALDTASQGKPVAGQEAAALEPLMKDMATVAQDPKLAGSFKSLVSQINQAQIKQQQST